MGCVGVCLLGAKGAKSLPGLGYHITPQNQSSI